MADEEYKEPKLYINNVLLYAINHDIIHLAKKIIQKNMLNFSTYTLGLVFSCKNNNYEMTEMLLDSLNDYTKKIKSNDVNAIINSKVYCIASGMYYCTEDNIMNLMKNNLDYITEPINCQNSINDYIENVFEHACHAGDMEIINMLLNIVPNLDPNDGLVGACKNGNIDLVNFIIALGPTDWNRGLLGACKYKHVKVVDLMISKGANDFNGGLKSVFDMDLFSFDNSYEYKYIYNLMISKGATNLLILEKEKEELESSYY